MWWRRSAVRFVEIRKGAKGRYRWIAYDEIGTVRAVPAKPWGFRTEGDAIRDARAIFPRCFIRISKGNGACET